MLHRQHIPAGALVTFFAERMFAVMAAIFSFSSSDLTGPLRATAPLRVTILILWPKLKESYRR
jgi:hypothetical protein